MELEQSDNGSFRIPRFPLQTANYAEISTKPIDNGWSDRNFLLVETLCLIVSSSKSWMAKGAQVYTEGPPCISSIPGSFPT